MSSSKVLLCLLLFAPPIQARLNVVTLPGRDTVQLTIYNSVDLTLVKETRRLTFRQGLNRLEFSWANTLIDPTSVELRAVTRADEVEVLDVRFPPRVANTLEWRIQSESAGEVVVEIRYFTSGIHWSADYVAEAGSDEKQMALAGSVRVNNRSGEDYENAQVRLVVGVVRLVEEIAQLARRAARDEAGKLGMTRVLASEPLLRERLYSEARASSLALEAASEVRQKEITKEGLSEYFLYTVEGRDTIANGWSKRLPSFRATGVPITSYYKFERERWGDRVMRHYKFTNAEPSQLGREPLPDGAVKAFRLMGADQLYSFVGHTQVKYIPVNETVEMELGGDQEVLVKPRLMHWAKTDIAFDDSGNVKGWTTRETWEIETQNSKEIGIVLEVRRNLTGDWELKSDAKFEKVDSTKVKFILPLPPREKHTLGYELTTRHGTNVRK